MEGNGRGLISGTVRHFSAKTEENHERIQSELAISKPWFEPCTRLIQRLDIQ